MRVMVDELLNAVGTCALGTYMLIWLAYELPRIERRLQSMLGCVERESTLNKQSGIFDRSGGR
jgi:hypothetical protein